MSSPRDNVLRLARLAQWRVRLVRAILAGLLGWTAWNVVAVIDFSFVGGSNLPLTALGLGGLWALACAIGALLVPCSAVRAAARIDRQRGLKERFATAVELARSGRVVVRNRSCHYDHEVALAWYPRPQMPAYLQDLIKAIK